MNAENHRGPLSPSRFSSGRNVLWIASVALVYFMVARLSLLLVFQPEGIAAIWPPEGVFLSAILLTRRDLRFYLVGTLCLADLLAELLAGTPFVVSAIYTLTLTGDAVLSSWLLLRFVGGPITFTKIREVFGFLTLAVILSNGLWSLVAAAASGLLPGTASFWNSWKWWAASDGIGNLLVTPFILSWAGWARSRWGTWNRKRAMESAALFIPLAILNFVAFSYLSKSGLFSLLLPYVTFPFLLWAAVRFGVRGVTSALVILAAIAVSFAAAGPIPAFPFYGSQLTAVIVVQLYLAILAVPSLLLVAVVTERARAEEALRRLSRKDEEALRVARMGHWEFDFATGRFTFNDPYYVLHGTTARAAGGYQMTAEEFARKYVHPDDTHLVQEHIQQATTAADPDFQVQAEARILRMDGEVRWVTVWFRIEKDAQGRTTKLYGVNQDITERKHAEEALRKSEALYHDLVETSQDLIWQCDQEGRYTYLNPAWATTFGYRLEEMLGKRFSAFQPPEYAERDEREFSRLMQGGTVKGYETVHCGRDGREIRLVFNAKFIREEQGKIVGTRGTAYDITERKQAEEALRELNATLEAKVAQRTEDLRHTVRQLRELTLELSQAEDRERKRIADILHEDVQQTLAAAKFHLNLLSSGAYRAEEGREIVEQVKHMLKDAIEKSRNLSHELSPAMYQVDLLEILSWLARHMQQKHGLTVRVEAHGPVDSPSEPLKAFLYKVAQELLFNVVKHAGVRQARIRVRRMGPCLYLSVVDRGRGFDPRKLERAAGFGLLGIRERVQSLGGRMKIKSAPGAGSRSLIAIPYEAASRIAGPAECRDGQVQPEAPARNNRAEAP